MCFNKILNISDIKSHQTSMLNDTTHGFAYWSVHSLALLIAPSGSFLKKSAISWSRGSSRLGADINDYTETKTDLIWRAGLHLSLRISRQILPNLSIFGWNILVLKSILGGIMGYSSGRYNSQSNIPPSYAVPSGPANFT